MCFNFVCFSCLGGRVKILKLTLWSTELTLNGLNFENILVNSHWSNIPPFFYQYTMALIYRWIQEKPNKNSETNTKGQERTPYLVIYIWTFPSVNILFPGTIPCNELEYFLYITYDGSDTVCHYSLTINNTIVWLSLVKIPLWEHR